MAQTGKRTTSGVVGGTKGRIAGISISASAGWTLVVYDNTAASGTELFKAAGSGTTPMTVMLPGVDWNIGCYCAVLGTPDLYVYFD